MNFAAHIVVFLRTNMFSSKIGVYSSHVQDIKHVFWEVRKGEVNINKIWECQGIPELRSLHSVRGYSTKDGN